MYGGEQNITPSLPLLGKGMYLQKSPLAQHFQIPPPLQRKVLSKEVIQHLIHKYSQDGVISARARFPMWVKSFSQQTESIKLSGGFKMKNDKFQIPFKQGKLKNDDHHSQQQSQSQQQIQSEWNMHLKNLQLHRNMHAMFLKNDRCKGKGLSVNCSQASIDETKISQNERSLLNTRIQKYQSCHQSQQSFRMTQCNEKRDPQPEKRDSSISRGTSPWKTDEEKLENTEEKKAKLPNIQYQQKMRSTTLNEKIGGSGLGLGGGGNFGKTVVIDSKNQQNNSNSFSSQNLILHYGMENENMKNTQDHPYFPKNILFNQNGMVKVNEEKQRYTQYGKDMIPQSYLRDSSQRMRNKLNHQLNFSQEQFNQAIIPDSSQRLVSAPQYKSNNSKERIKIETAQQKGEGESHGNTSSNFEELELYYHNKYNPTIIGNQVLFERQDQFNLTQPKLEQNCKEKIKLNKRLLNKPTLNDKGFCDLEPWEHAWNSPESNFFGKIKYFSDKKLSSQMQQQKQQQQQQQQQQQYQQQYQQQQQLKRDLAISKEGFAND